LLHAVSLPLPIVRALGYHCRTMTPRALFVFCLLASVWFHATSGQAAEAELDLRSIPIAEWLSASDTAQIPWSVQIGTPDLRMDQRLEVPYNVRIGSKQLNRAGDTHDLFLITRVSSLDGEWLNEPAILRQDIEEKLP